MPELTFENPSAPFVELWAFRITLTPDRREPRPPANPWEVRDRAIQHLRAEGHAPNQPESEGDEIRKEILDIVTDHLSSPDYRFFVTDYEERPGSWEIAFVIVGALYGGVCGYGAFRQGMEYVYSDLKTVFGAIEGLKAKVRKRFKERHVLATPRIEPTVDWKKTNVES
jgi:hypothetical protein